MEVIKEPAIKELKFEELEGTILPHYIAMNCKGEKIHVCYSYHRSTGYTWDVSCNGHIYGHRNKKERAFKLANKINSLEVK